jgi:hypothetical protein
MKIADLKKLIEKLPDDMEVVVSGRDHSFVRLSSCSQVIQAECSSSGHLSQYWHDNVKLDPENKVIEVFWIDDGKY